MKSERKTEMKIAVLAGGLSPERDVSLSSGGLIANALKERGHSVALIDVYMDQDITDGVENKFTDKLCNTSGIAENSPDLEKIALLRRERRGSGDGADELVGRGVLDICRAADITFIALHGAMGENGQLQALLDCCGIRYTGSGYAGCLLAMDKDITKRIVSCEGVDTAKWVCAEPNETDVRSIAEQIGFPCVIKPVACGSSVGVSLVHNENELEQAFRTAAECNQTVLAEQFIGGREFSVGILCGKALPSIEIMPISGFYDYKNKYQSGLTNEVTPSNIPSELEQRLRNAALKVHRALHLGVYSRSDFIYDGDTDRLVFLEANTLPGMTPMSLLPKEAAAAGIEYGELCDVIVRESLKRNRV